MYTYVTKSNKAGKNFLTGAKKKSKKTTSDTRKLTIGGKIHFKTLYNKLRLHVQ